MISRKKFQRDEQVKIHWVNKKVKEIRPILAVFSIALFALASCSNDEMEVWQSTYQLIVSDNDSTERHFQNDAQYLILHSSGEATLVDSDSSDTPGITLAKWKIMSKESASVFSLDPINTSEGLKGITYPIVVKNDTDFRMKFDSTSSTGHREMHVWNLKRLPNKPY